MELNFCTSMDSIQKQTSCNSTTLIDLKCTDKIEIFLLSLIINIQPKSDMTEDSITYIFASVCYILTCYQVVYFVKTWYNHRCGTLSFLLVLPCVVAEIINISKWVTSSYRYIWFYSHSGCKFTVCVILLVKEHRIFETRTLILTTI